MTTKKKKIGIIGSGWFGCHMAFALQKEGFDTVLYEKNKRIVAQTSKNFGGGRVHAGQHYPRSSETRENCREGLVKFRNTYPEFVIESEYSIYGLGEKDAFGEPPKIGKEEFKKVCEESSTCTPIEPEEYGFKNLLNAFNIPNEPSIAIGKLRDYFEKRITQAGGMIKCNAEVKKIEKKGDKFLIIGDGFEDEVDHVINATSYQALLPKELPIEGMSVVYQPVLGLVYEDTQKTSKPLSFTVMDGWFPCLAPFNGKIKNANPEFKRYLLTHCRWTIMGSCNTPEEANAILEKIDDKFIETQVKPKSENEMDRFWPGFSKRFKFLGFKQTVLAKTVTSKDFRSALTWKSKDGVIIIFPGKISNIFNAEKETLALINNQNVISNGSCQYVKNGVLDRGVREVTEKPIKRSTYSVQTYDDLKRTNFINTNFAKPSQEGRLDLLQQLRVIIKNREADSRNRSLKSQGKPHSSNKRSKQRVNEDIGKLKRQNSETDNKAIKNALNELPGMQNADFNQPLNFENLLFSAFMFFNKGFKVVGEQINEYLQQKGIPSSKLPYFLNARKSSPNLKIKETRVAPLELIIYQPTTTNTSTQEKLIKIWEGVFKNKTFHVTDTFTDLHASQIQIMQLLNSVNNEFLSDDENSLDLSEFEKASTIQSLAVLIDERLEKIKKTTLAKSDSKEDFSDMNNARQQFS